MVQNEEHIEDEIKEEIPQEVKLTWEERLKNIMRFDDKNLLNNLPLVLFVGILGVLHVANNHTAENKIRHINALEQDIKEQRWLYMSKKAELMYKSKQSEVAKMVEESGLKELINPPYKIEIDKDDYK